MESRGKLLNPVVVLEDIRKSFNIQNQNEITMENVKINLQSLENHYNSESAFESTKTTLRSTQSPSCLKPKPQDKKRTWSSTREYEIEKIVGYHRDRKKRMWYLIKWKGWSEKDNTYEPIENLTGCNYKLMKFFEMKKPTVAELNTKKLEIKRSLSTHKLYQQLVTNNYPPELLAKFSAECIDISNLFNAEKLKTFKGKIKKEYHLIVRCLIGMYSHQDPGMFARGQNYSICLHLIDVRKQQLEKNSKCEKVINAIEKVLVTIENNVDLDPFPENLTYVNDLKHHDDILVPKDPLLGCECVSGCNQKSKCCGKMAGFEFAYTTNGKVRLIDRIPIYECNWRCRCPSTCPNRVVQRGRTVKLCIFKTRSCGWGVKTLEPINKGAFVCEYIGELIPDAVAVVRDIDYYKRNLSYLFDLDFCPDNSANMYCIDATNFGNLARFINHSCDPNLVVYPVWIDCLDPSLHRLAFFAKRNIKKDEEIHFDYENFQGVPDDSEQENCKKNPRLKMMAKVKCQCKTDNCRKWVFGNK